MSGFDVWNELGNTFLKEGAYDDAIDAYGKALEQELKIGMLYSNLALTYTLKGKFSEAIPLYLKSLSLLDQDREKAITYGRLGDAYRELNEYDRAIEAYQKAVEIDPEYAAQNNIGSMKDPDDTEMIDPVPEEVSIDEMSRAETNTKSEPSLSLDEAVETPAENDAILDNSSNPDPGAAVSGTVSREIDITISAGNEGEQAPVQMAGIIDPDNGESSPSPTELFEAIDIPTPAVQQSEDAPGSETTSIETIVVENLDENVESQRAQLNTPINSDAEDALILDLPTWSESTSQRVNLLLTLGIIHRNRGDYERALELIESALETSINLGDKSSESLSYQTLALIKIDFRELDLAIDFYNKSLELTPERTSLWRDLGNLYSESDRNEEAISAYQKAIEYAAEDGASWDGLGDVYCKTGKVDEAIAMYQLANNFEMQKRKDETLSNLKKALEIDSSDAMVWNDLGTIFLKVDALDEAAAAFLKAIELDAKFDLSYRNLAMVDIRRGYFLQAVASYQKCLELIDDHTEKASLWNEIAGIYRRMGDFDGARSAYKKAVKLDPDNKTYKDELKQLKLESEQTEAQSAIALDDPGSQDIQPLTSEANVEPAEVSPNGVEVEGSGNFLVLEETSAMVEPILQPGQEGKQEGTVGNDFQVQPEAELEPLTIEEADALQSDPSTADEAILEPANFPQGEAVDLSEGEIDGEASDEVASPEEMMVSPWIPLMESDSGEVGHNTALDPGEIEPHEETVLEAAPSPDLTADSIVSEGPSEATASIAVEPPSSLAEDTDQKSDPPYAKRLQETDEDIDRIVSAIAAYKKVTEINPKNDRAWDSLGSLYRAMERYSDAIAAFEQAISLDPAKEAYHYHLGLVLAAARRFEEAIGAFQNVIEINPGHIFAHCALAGYLRRVGRDEEAVKHIEIALPKIQNEKEYDRACFESICGNTEKALELLAIALTKKQTSLEWVRRDPDLDFIRDDPRFDQLVVKYEQWCESLPKMISQGIDISSSNTQ